MGRPSIALTASSAAYIVAGFFLTILLARMLGPGGFGAYTVVAALLTVVNLVVGRGVPVAAARAIARDPAGARPTMRAAVRASAGLAVLVATLTLLLAAPAGELLGEEIRTPLLIGAAAAATFSVQALAVAPLNGLLRFGMQAVTRFAYAGSRLVLVPLGAWLAGLEGAVAGFVLAPFVASIPALTRHAVPVEEADRPATDPSTTPGADGGSAGHELPPDARDLLRQAVPLLLTATWVSLLLSVDLIAFRAVGSATDTGYYGAAGTLAHVPFYLLAMLPTEILPRVAAADDAGRRALAARLLDDAMVMLAAPCIAVIVAAPFVVGAIFGSRYEAAIPLVAPLTVATAAVSMHAMLTAVDGAVQRLGPAVAIGASGTAAMAGAVAVAGAERGVVAAAWAAAAVAVLFAAAHWATTIVARRAAPPRGASAAGAALIAASAAAAYGARPDLGVAVGTVLLLVAVLLAARRFSSGLRRPLATR